MRKLTPVQRRHLIELVEAPYWNPSGAGEAAVARSLAKRGYLEHDPSRGTPKWSLTEAGWKRGTAERQGIPLCPVCGDLPVETRVQVQNHHHPGALGVEMKPGEVRFICADGHYFDQAGEDRGTSMPPDVTIKHDAGLRG